MRRVWILACAVLSGWAALFAATYLVEWPLFKLIGPLLGAGWPPTLQMLLDCFAMGAAGWVVGSAAVRLHESGVTTSVLVFAVTLALLNLGVVPGLVPGLVPEVDLSWLIRLAANTLHDERYFESLVTAVTTHALLFGSLIAGGRLSRPRSELPSITGPVAGTDPN